MVWHVEGQNTPITVCAGKKGEKGFLRVSVVEKAHSKQKHQKPILLLLKPFFQNTKNHGSLNEGNTYKPFMKVLQKMTNWKNTTMAVTSLFKWF